jgi:hypothetical protein
VSILWIVPKWPLPAHDGARHATVSLVTNLVAQGRVIDLLALAGHDETIDMSLAKSELGVRDVMVIRRSGGEADRLGLLTAALLRPLTPITMRHYCTPRMRRRLGALLRGASEASDMRLILPESQHGPWRTVVYDGLHPACSSSSCGKFVRPPGIDHIVYRAHNREADIWLRKVSQSAGRFRRFLFGYQARRVRVFENSVVAQSDALRASVLRGSPGLWARLPASQDAGGADWLRFWGGCATPRAKAIAAHVHRSAGLASEPGGPEVVLGNRMARGRHATGWIEPGHRGRWQLCLAFSVPVFPQYRVPRAHSERRAALTRGHSHPALPRLHRT